MRRLEPFYLLVIVNENEYKWYDTRIAAASTVKFLLDRVTKLCRNNGRKPTQLKGYLCSGL
jgi:hypothetical protein